MRISDWSSDVCSSDLLDLAVEMAAVAHDRHRLHRSHMFGGDDVGVAGRGAKDVGAGHRLVHGDDLEPLHRRLQRADRVDRSEEHTSELQSLMRISYAVFCLKKKKKNQTTNTMLTVTTPQKNNTIKQTHNNAHKS